MGLKTLCSTFFPSLDLRISPSGREECNALHLWGDRGTAVRYLEGGRELCKNKEDLGKRLFKKPKE